GGGATSGGQQRPGQNEAREWSFFGVDIPISSLSALAHGHEPSPASPTSLSPDPRRPPSSLTNQELFSTSFGGERWKLEILKPTTGDSEKLSLYLSCQILDTAFSPDIIPTTLMFGIREPREQIGKREAREGWVWRVWENEWCFGTNNEYFECHSFPSFEVLLQNPRIAELDSFVLSIQISSPVQATVPQIQNSHHVPRDLLLGVQNLIDDRLTSDIILYTHERQDLGSGSSIEGTDEEAMRYRKRSLYVHSTILRARSSYFEDMLTSGWAETSGVGERKMNVVKIEDFDFVTVYWLIHYLYTNEVTFQQTEDVRLLPPDELPSGWLSNPNELTWDWFTTSDLISPPAIAIITPLNLSGHLSDIAETETPPPEDYDASNSSTPALSSKAQGKRRGSTGNSSSSVQVNSTKRRPPTPDEPGSPTRLSSAGRISPLGGRISPSTSRVAISRRIIAKEEEKVEDKATEREADPHAHPVRCVTPASALAIYQIADRYSLVELASLALCHVIATLTPRTAFPLLLSTHLWPDLHAAIKEYALANYEAVCREPEFRRCYAEVGEGLWEHGGEVLLDFTLQLTPLATAWRGT
ncbi:hypothetical protein P7C70_g8100, partial [Phenoliferia sp. Uapishka_3]